MTDYQNERDMSQPNYYDKYKRNMESQQECFGIEKKPSHNNFWECPYCGKVFGNKFTAVCDCKVKHEVVYE